MQKSQWRWRTFHRHHASTLCLLVRICVSYTDMNQMASCWKRRAPWSCTERWFRTGRETVELSMKGMRKMYGMGKDIASYKGKLVRLCKIHRLYIVVCMDIISLWHILNCITPLSPFSAVDAIRHRFPLERCKADKKCNNPTNVKQHIRMSYLWLSILFIVNML